jgi:hypothetical protein
MKINTDQIKIIVPILILLGFGVFWYFINRNSNKNPEISTTPNSSVQNESGDMTGKEFGFENKGLKTNTARLSIPLDKILDGGPGKDGIPALTNPKFVSVKEASKNIKDDVDGIVVSSLNTVKFYPYNIMVWHEIVNDVVGGKTLVITFCPLCGSAIVFDAEINGKAEQFGVSGKLYESNLLMYDKSTESLWSQSIGTAVVGDRTGEKLSVYPSQVVSFKILKEKWPNSEVLSTDTGYGRSYDFYPYGDYNNNDSLYFPISIKDNRFPPKEIMYVVNAYDKSVAFPTKQLGGSPASVDVGGNKVTGAIVDGEIIVKDTSGKILPGYHEMWFSWATHHQEDGVVWKK